jgi:hypothetical protein
MVIRCQCWSCFAVLVPCGLRVLPVIRRHFGPHLQSKSEQKVEVLISIVRLCPLSVVMAPFRRRGSKGPLTYNRQTLSYSNREDGSDTFLRNISNIAHCSNSGAGWIWGSEEQLHYTIMVLGLSERPITGRFSAQGWSNSLYIPESRLNDKFSTLCLVYIWYYNNNNLLWGTSKPTVHYLQVPWTRQVMCV